MNKNKDVVVVEFNEELLEEWTQLYFKKHPRARKKPIENCIHPSINKWCILPRISMNALKHKWGEFTKYVLQKQNKEMLGINKCKVEVIIHKATAIRCDADNYCLKFCNDQFVDSGLLVDDSYKVITETTTKIIYDKGINKMEVIFKDCEYDLDALKEAQDKEKIKREKREATLEKNKAEKKAKKSKRNKVIKK